jgi:hypothetical protein
MSRTELIVTSIPMKEGRCKFCHARIFFAMRASQPGKPAVLLPWDHPKPWPLSVVRNDDTGLVIETWSMERIHFASCTRKPVRKFRPARRRVHA